MPLIKQVQHKTLYSVQTSEGLMDLYKHSTICKKWCL